MTFDKPLPVPQDGIVLYESEKEVLRSYYAEIQNAKAQFVRAQRAFDAIVTVVANRNGSFAKGHVVSADFGFIQPVKE